jgi:hypothetical protein
MIKPVSVFTRPTIAVISPARALSLPITDLALCSHSENIVKLTYRARSLQRSGCR